MNAPTMPNLDPALAATGFCYMLAPHRARFQDVAAEARPSATSGPRAKIDCAPHLPTPRPYKRLSSARSAT